MKTVCLSIDGKKIFAEEGTTILEAARQNGIEIPTLCYHPRVAPLGHCRVCIVAVEGFNKPITSCDNPVTEGMVVTTTTEEIRDMRSKIINLSLATHPYKDCLTCERTGTCELQENAYNFQVELPEQLEREMPAAKDEDNDYIVRDEEKCILCGRCIKVCRTGAGCSVFEMIGNGVNTRVVPYRNGEEVTLEEAGCIFCGQCVDVCPVAALTETKRSARGREWELTPAAGVCVECSLGCVLERQVADGAVVRVTVPREESRNGRLCRKGRYGVEAEAAETVNAPLIQDKDGFQEVSYDEAIRFAAGQLKAIKEKSGSQALAVIGSGRASNEEAYLLQKLARTVLGTTNVDLGAEPSWVTAYMKARDLAGPAAEGPTTADLAGAEAIAVLGSGLEDSHPVAAMAVRHAARYGNAAVIRIGAQPEDGMTWRELLIDIPAAAYPVVLNGIAAAARGEDPAPAAKEAGISAEVISEAATLLRGLSTTVVTPQFLDGADDKLIEAMISLAEATGQLAPGRNRLLLLSAFSNAAGLLAVGGAPHYGPGYSSLNGRAGLTREEILQQAGEGKIEGLIAFGSGFANLAGPSFIAACCGSRNEVPGAAGVIFPALPVESKNGHYTGSAGQTIHNTAALVAASNSREEWLVICELARALGADWHYDSLGSVREELEGQLPV